MQREAAISGVAIGIAILIIALAFFVAPHACEWGLELYAWTGAAALLVLIALPFAARMRRSATLRVAWAAGFMVLGVGAWIVGLFGANVRIICGLGYL